MIPSEYRSDSGVAGLPTACSGERYWAVPMTMPVAVMFTWLRASDTPKSVIFTRPTAAQQDVAGLDVAVDHTGQVRRVQRAGGLREDRQEPPGGQHGLALEQVGQGLADDELHDEEAGALLLAVVEQLRDVRVGQRRGVAGLGAEPLEEPAVPGELRCAAP